MTASAARISSAPGARIGRYWWIPLAAGLLTMLVGIIALVYPGPTLLAVGIIFGAYLVFWGGMYIVRGIAGEDELSTSLRMIFVLLGLLTVLAGLVLLVRPGESVLTAALVLGFWWVLTGVMQLARGFAVAEDRVSNLLLGLLGIVVGVIILAQPEIGLITLVWIAGIGLLLQGALEVAAGWQLRRLHHEVTA